MTAYYNEIDPFAAQWLRNLIAAGLIAPGVVDERSIVDVRPSELAVFTQCHFFAGIGGWSLALRGAGWPDDRPVWTGSCPCQPFSVAGKGKGSDDERHLWPVWFDLIRECRPSAVFGEQVAAAVGHNWLDAVSRDMEGEGYAIGSAVLGAHSVGSPHIRQRLWFVADATGGRQPRRIRERGQTERSEREAGGHGSAGGMADAVPAGRAEWRAEPGDGSPAGVRCPGGMGDPGGAGSQVCEREAVLGEGRRHEGGTVEQSGGSFGVLADADNQRLQRVWTDANSEGRAEPDVPTSGLCDGAGVGGSGPLHGFWRDADWLFCRDGKWRPVEPGSFPLAHGLPGRVGRLRAYGNAIVPQVAAEFIAAFEECRP